MLDVEEIAARMMRHSRVQGGFVHFSSVRVAAFAALSVSVTASVVNPQQGNQTQRYPQFENDEVRVWKSVVMPNTPLAMHRHEHGRVIIALAGGTMKIVESGGGEEKHVWETGKAYWLPKNPPGETHSDVNAGDKPIEVMVVEIKNDK
jgi:beta-alanine degradation protein BauB